MGLRGVFVEKGANASCTVPECPTEQQPPYFIYVGFLYVRVHVEELYQSMPVECFDDPIER